MRHLLRRLSPVLLIAVVLALVTVLNAQRQPPPSPGAPLPIDPQNVQDQDNMTWADYKPIPGKDWADPSLKPERTLTLALVAIDFDDQPFVMTLPKQSDPFGNPQIDPIKREAVPQFFADFITKPSALNHGQTIHRYWMEISRGKVGVPKVDAFGPYRMPRKLFEYGLGEYGQEVACPAGYTCNGRMEADADALWAKAAGADVKSKYDRVLRLYAGYDETSVWQEFGEMKFNTKEDIPEAWGNPDKTKPRWAPTRYVDWTSWLAGAQQWGLSSIRQGESSGTITHEMGHAVMNIGDNNNNPYAKPYHRVGTGTWDMMDRGGFNGPGGPHSRWVVPVQQGGSMPAGFLLRNKIWAGFVTPDQVLRVDRDSLPKSGLAVATVVARAVEPGPGQFAGMLVRLDGDAFTRPQRGAGGGGAAGRGGAATTTYADKSPACDTNTDPLCSLPQFNNFTMEVVQRIGYDSFTTDNGVLLVKNKDQQGPACGYSCHAWVIDAHPQDMNMVDFVRPNGTKVMRTIADYRQLNDALFHAGLRSGSQFEWEDTPNRLHFYVIDRAMSAGPEGPAYVSKGSGVLSYVVGVRSLDGAGPQTRGVAAALATTGTINSASGPFTVRVTNTGKDAPVPAGTQPSNVPAAFAQDIYRVTVKVTGQGWNADVANALVAVPFGASANVPVYAWKSAGAAATATVTVTIASESDPARTASVTGTVR